MTVAAGKGNADGSEIGRSVEEAQGEAGAEHVEFALVGLLMTEFLWDAHSVRPNLVSDWLRPNDSDRSVSGFL